MGVRPHRYSDCVTKTKRWRALRRVILERDNYTCRECGEYGNEVDHIESVRRAPDRAFDETNLQTLCGGCHSLKTLTELGRAPLSEGRKQWRTFMKKQEQGELPCLTV